MIRKMVFGLALLFVCTLPKAQTSTSTAIGDEYVDVGGSKIWYEECVSSAPGLGALCHLERCLGAAMF